MRYTLLESGAPSERRAAGTVASILLHSGAIALAIVSTARATPRSRSEPAATPVIYTAPPRPAPSAPVRSATRDAARRVGTLVETIRPPLIGPVAVPGKLPVIDAHALLTDPGVFDGTAPSATAGGDAGISSGPADGVWTAALVEKPVMARSDNPHPRYPESLRAVHLEGAVAARFVVDSTGRVEPGSIVVSEATHALFADAVREALLRSRYVPAEVGGRRVRQLVEQRFAFQLAP